MLHLDTPTARDIARLNELRAPVVVSIYVPTTPITQDIQASRIDLKNRSRAAIEQIEQAGGDKRMVAAIRDHLEDLVEDDEFWRLQAHSLAVFVTPDRLRTYRLANRLEAMVEVSDRAHLKPLLRSVTFPQAAYVLAISENAVRLVEVSADLPAVSVDVPNLPKDAASAVGKATINDRSPSGRLQGAEGQKVRLSQYIRQIDAALRPVLADSDLPLILAATQPVEALFRSVSVLEALPDVIAGSHDSTPDAELATAARPVLDAHYRREIKAFHDLWAVRNGQNRATADLSDAARAATFGTIDRILVNMESVVNGLVDEDTGALLLDQSGDATNYGVVDEIAGRALRSGAKVMAVRQDDIPGKGELAAILRSPL